MWSKIISHCTWFIYSASVFAGPAQPVDESNKNHSHKYFFHIRFHGIFLYLDLRKKKRVSIKNNTICGVWGVFVSCMSDNNNHSIITISMSSQYTYNSFFSSIALTLSQAKWWIKWIIFPGVRLFRFWKFYNSN